MRKKGEDVAHHQERGRDERELTESLDLKIGEENMHWDAEEIENKKND